MSFASEDAHHLQTLRYQTLHKVNITIKLSHIILYILIEILGHYKPVWTC